jgi:hypothetical protein
VRRWVVLGLALAVGNFLYQGIEDHLWGVAFERSYFQALALVAAAIAFKG